MTSVFLHLPIRGNRRDHATREYSVNVRVNVQFSVDPAPSIRTMKPRVHIRYAPVARNEKELAGDRWQSELA